ncbi:T9SS type A sorting domain-containing protein [Luteibaculum oceani]|uniref:T9SS type A sorting domain-containing protein n=1 Tax=Luteibaculum oceani TaxID=1294296 RepID=A0A5C6VIZ4_9FLAO|nr:T9SS type A sorting domain-containing protein [Luteibaculum oceani]TXC85453.1 T9SS type A sorting domain-containing protein [Luteibaculum oceani]
MSKILTTLILTTISLLTFPCFAQLDYSLSTKSKQYANFPGDTLPINGSWKEEFGASPIQLENFELELIAGEKLSWLVFDGNLIALMDTNLNALTISPYSFTNGTLQDRNYDTNLSKEDNLRRDPSSYIIWGVKENVVGKHIVIQYTNVVESSSCTNADSINFQLKIWENGIIELHYGPNSIQSKVNLKPTIQANYWGINGSTEITQLYLTGDPNNPQLDTNRSELDGPAVDGTLYRLTPDNISSIHSAKQTGEKIFSCYPNPSETGVYTLKAKGELFTGPWKVLDSKGSELISGEGSSVDISEVKSGIYFLVIKENGAPIKLVRQ